MSGVVLVDTQPPPFFGGYIFAPYSMRQGTPTEAYRDEDANTWSMWAEMQRTSSVPRRPFPDLFDWWRIRLTPGKAVASKFASTGIRTEQYRRVHLGF